MIRDTEVKSKEYFSIQSIQLDEHWLSIFYGVKTKVGILITSAVLMASALPILFPRPTLHPVGSMCEHADPPLPKSAHIGRCPVPCLLLVFAHITPAPYQGLLRPSHAPNPPLFLLFFILIF